MNRNVVTFGVLIILVFASQAHADWIKGIFSKEAGIDSLERFLVLHDVDSNIVFGDPILSLGDINNDGYTDILIGRFAYPSHEAFLFEGGFPPDTSYVRGLHPYWTLPGQIGDINNDGFADFGWNQSQGSDFEIHFGGPSLNENADCVLPDILSRVTKAVDLDDDGILELALSQSINGGYIDIYQVGVDCDTTPEFTIPDTSRDFGNNLVTGDFNGDGYPDLAVAAFLNRDSSFIKFYWGGPSFDTIPDYEIWQNAHRFGEILLPLGDFNGDGYEDIYIGGGISQTHAIREGIYFGGPGFDGNIDIVVNRFSGVSYFTPTSAAKAGDINHDGYPDLVLGYTNPYAFLNEVRVFLGGPVADSVVDVYIEAGDLPLHPIDFGAVVAGIGDFDGDGIDDFAVRSRNMGGCCWMGQVNFFAGWDGDGSDVDYEFEPTYPKTFDLKQNYPNPFNLSTTIEFSLPRHSHAKLIVYNLLGERVATLLDRDLPAGLHRVTWDGADSSGLTVASGVYFYRVATEAGSETRKMVLMK